jgi:membrane fusion protein (multidrug efflux system)
LREAVGGLAYTAQLTLAMCAAGLFAVAGCSKSDTGRGVPPLEVSVIKTLAAPVTVYEDYVAQTEAVDTVEIRARVSGVLERQAFVDGSYVKKDELLFVIDQQPFIAALAQAKATLAQARATHLDSARTLERNRQLVAERFISQQALDSAIAKEAADAASVDAARAQVTTAELNLDYATIRAPRDGMISKALIKRGGLVNASTTLLTTLYSVSPIYVNFTISELNLPRLQRALGAEPGEDGGKGPQFRLKLSDGSEYKFPGKLNFVDAAVDPKSGTLQVRLSVPNPDRLLRPGQFVRVVLPVLQELNAIRVPQSAVQELQGKRSVLVVDADGKVAYREIVARTRLDNDWVVESGLKPGELVIAEGINKVRPGVSVKPVLAAPADAAGDRKDTASKPGEGSAKAAGDRKPG